MSFCPTLRLRALATALTLLCSVSASAAEIGRIKVSTGEVSVERGDQKIPGIVGTRLEAADVIRTGSEGAVGVTMSDNSLLSAGPNSILSLDRYVFDPTTNDGRFELELKKGSLAVISGRIAKKAPEAMTVRTPSAVLGVRGTEFALTTSN